MKTVYTAVLGPYEKLKEPKIISKGWKYICYTDQDFKSDVWKIYKIDTPDNPRRQARIIKAWFYNYARTYYSMWIDGSFLINCDLNDFWDKYFKLPFSAPAHPQRKCVFEEALQIIKGQRGGREGIESQIQSYVGIVPPGNGLITSGILLRQKTPRCMDLCDKWIAETIKEGNSLRDQVSFAKVSMEYADIIHMSDYKYDQMKDLRYHPHKDVVIDGVNYF